VSFAEPPHPRHEASLLVDKLHGGGETTRDLNASAGGWSYSPVLSRHNAVKPTERRLFMGRPSVRTRAQSAASDHEVSKSLSKSPRGGPRANLYGTVGRTQSESTILELDEANQPPDVQTALDEEEEEIIEVNGMRKLVGRKIETARLAGIGGDRASKTRSQTIRKCITIHLPGADGHEVTRHRYNPTLTVQQLLEQVCRKRNLLPHKYELRWSVTSMAMPRDQQISTFPSKEFFVCSLSHWGKSLEEGENTEES